MDNQPAPSVIQSGYKPALFIPILLLVIGFAAGLIAEPALNLAGIFKKPQPTSATKTSSSQVKESDLPISLPLLKSPLVYEWRGSIKGTITKKEPHSVTVGNDKGDSITLRDTTPTGEKWQTIYIDNKTEKLLSYSDIATGSAVLGDFFIFKGYPDMPVAASLTRQ